MRISLSVIGKLDYYYEELKKINITINDIAIPAIGNPNIEKHKKYENWALKMKKNIQQLVDCGISRSDLLINVPINQIINNDINDIDKLIDFLICNNIVKVIIIKGNGNMGDPLIKVEDFVYELRKKNNISNLKIFVALYPSHKLSFSKEIFGKSTFLDIKHLSLQIKKIKKIDKFVDGYMTQITVNGNKSAEWLNIMSKHTDKLIFLGISAPTTKKLDIMHIRTQLNYICKDKKFLLDNNFMDIIIRVFSKPHKWIKILKTINIGVLDMLWRFRLTRIYSFEKLIDDLKENIDTNSKINIHFNSGGQNPKEAMKYIKLLNKLNI